MLHPELIPLVKQLRDGEDMVWWRGMCFTSNLDATDYGGGVFLYKTRRGFSISHCSTKDCGGFRIMEPFQDYYCPYRYILQWDNWIGMLVDSEKTPRADPRRNKKPYKFWVPSKRKHR